jgi:hypothetical protein
VSGAVLLLLSKDGRCCSRSYRSDRSPNHTARPSFEPLPSNAEPYSFLVSCDFSTWIRTMVKIERLDTRCP